MILLPSARPSVPTISYTYRQPIRSASFEEILSAQGWSYSRMGSRRCGLSFGDTPWDTTETTYVEYSDSGDVNLWDANLLIQPVRKDVGGYHEAGGAGDTLTGRYLVEVSAFAQGADVQIEFIPVSTDTPLSDTASYTVEIPAVDASTPSRRSAWVIIDMDYTGLATEVTGYRLRLNGKLSPYAGVGVTGYVWQVGAKETHLRNASSDGTLEVYGDEWIGRYAESDAVYSWSSDGASTTWQQVTGGYEPLMRRDEVRTGVHAAYIGGATRFCETAVPVDCGTDGAIFATALRVDTTGSWGYALAKVNASLTSVLRIAHNTSGNLYILSRHGGANHVPPTIAMGTGAWHDVVVAVRDGGTQLVVFVDGELAYESGTLAVWDESSGHITAGCYSTGTAFLQGAMALPAVISGDFTIADIGRFAQSRLAFLGIGS